MKSAKMVAALAITLYLVTPAFAQQKLKRAEVEQWADNTFGKLLAEHRFSALAIAVTEGDQVVLTKGYGYADWVTKSPVLPDKTQFRIGSLTKTFTATAVAQLLERGRISSLDDPVNKYLKRTQLKKNAGQDITIWDLLTHRAGYANASTSINVSTNNSGNTGGDPRPQLPLPGNLLTAETPEFVRPKDTVSVYCNFCIAMLGMMVEDITGQILEDYFRQNIYKPLGMTNTVLAYGSKPTADIVTQYTFAPNGDPIPVQYPSLRLLMAAAGDMNSTAADMAKWIKTHAQEGRGSGSQILSQKSFELMHRRHRGNQPEMSGFGMAFFTYDYNGERVLEHYGSISFRSLEIIMPDKKIGIFVTVGGGGPVEPAVSHSGLRALLLEHFIGPLQMPKTPMKVDIGKYTGSYRNIANNTPLAIEDSHDGGLVIGGLGVYRPSAPNIFTLDRTLPLESGFGVSNRYAFVTDSSGKVIKMFGHVNAGGYEK